MKKTFDEFYEELVTVAREAANDKLISVAILLESENAEISEWMMRRDSNSIYKCSPAERAGQQYDIPRQTTELVLQKAIKRHDEDMCLVKQGVFEHHDVRHEIVVEPPGLDCVYYNFCEIVDTAMTSVGLGKGIARLTVVTYSPEGIDVSRNAQRCISIYVRGFLSKNNLGTTTTVD